MKKEYDGFLVIKKWQGGLIEYVGCYFNEEKARYIAGQNAVSTSFGIYIERVTVHSEVED